MRPKSWMPLYVGDFTADTAHLGATETGIYIRLIMHCWQHGTIPRDERRLAIITHCDTRLWHQYRTVLQFFDVVDASTMHHKRVSKEIQRCEEISNKRKDAAEQMLSKRRANAEQMLTQPQPQSQPQRQSKQRGGRKVPTPLAESWNPREESKDFGRSIGLSHLEIERELIRFRRHATDNKRLCSNWDKAFNAWLGKGAEFMGKTPQAPEAKSKVFYDEKTKLWEWINGYEPTDEERYAHAKYRATALRTRIT